MKGAKDDKWWLEKDCDCVCNRNRMSLRDYFAGQALAGLCNQNFWDAGEERDISNRAYGLADAMLEARKEKTKARSEYGNNDDPA